MLTALFVLGSIGGQVIERQARALQEAEEREGRANAANTQLQEDANDVQQRLQASLNTTETKLSLTASELKDANDAISVLQNDLKREVEETGHLRQTIASLERRQQEQNRIAAERISKLEIALSASQDSNAQLTEASLFISRVKYNE